MGGEDGRWELEECVTFARSCLRVRGTAILVKDLGMPILCVDGVDVAWRVCGRSMSSGKNRFVMEI